MQNLKITIPLANGTIMDLSEQTGEDQIDVLAPDLPAHKGMLIEVTSPDGRHVTITIPNSPAEQVAVRIDG